MPIIWITRTAVLLISQLFGRLSTGRLLEHGDGYLFQIEYEQLDNKEVKECLGKLENHQELVYIT